MKSKGILYERDLLFSTNQESEIGVVQVQLIDIKNSNKLITIVKPKSNHNPLDYMEQLLEIINCEIFKRVNINININVYIIVANGDKAYRIIFVNSDSLIPFSIKELEQSEYESLKLKA